MSAYWQQWDRADLHSWLGKEIDSVQDDKECIEREHNLELELLHMPNLMDEYGLAYWMFL